MANGILELQKAVYKVLSEDSALSGLVTGVYNHVPQGTAFPYIRLENISAESRDTKTRHGYLATFSLSVYSRYRGNKEALEIMQEVRRLLSNARLPMENGWKMIGVRFLSLDIDEEGDGLTYAGTMVFRSWISEIVA